MTEYPHRDSVRTLELEFIELSAREPEPLKQQLSSMGFTRIAKHRHKPVSLYRKGSANLILNESDTGLPKSMAEEHGVAICAIGLKVEESQQAFATLSRLGAWPVETRSGAMELNIPAVEGVGGSQIFLIDKMPNHLSIYDIDFQMLEGVEVDTQPCELAAIELTLAEGRLTEWRDFFVQLFGFVAETENDVRCPDSGVCFHLKEALPSSANVGLEYLSGVVLKQATSHSDISWPVHTGDAETGVSWSQLDAETSSTASEESA
ncbi:MAG: hypothetical protein ACPGYX_11020 [Oceanobacter sp.]